MHTFDVKVIKEKLEGISSYEAKIKYLKKTIKELDSLKEETYDLIDMVNDQQHEYYTQKYKEELSNELKNAGIVIPINEYNEMIIVYGKAEFKIITNLYHYTLWLSLNITGRKYREKVMSLLPEYSLNGNDFRTIEATKETIMAKSVALVKKLLAIKDQIIKLNEMLR